MFYFMNIQFKDCKRNGLVKGFLSHEFSIIEPQKSQPLKAFGSVLELLYTPLPRYFGRQP